MREAANSLCIKLFGTSAGLQPCESYTSPPKILGRISRTVSLTRSVSKHAHKMSGNDIYEEGGWAQIARSTSPFALFIQTSLGSPGAGGTLVSMTDDVSMLIHIGPNIGNTNMTSSALRIKDVPHPVPTLVSSCPSNPSLPFLPFPPLSFDDA